MVMKVDPTFIKRIGKLGAFDITACFDCGNCTAICPLSNEFTNFPRKMIHYAKLGLEKKILEKPCIWLCDYCAQCSESCPRNAEPGEFMMAMRRYSISKYSCWNKIAERLYASRIFNFLFISITSLIILALIGLYHGPINMNSVALFDFLPVLYIDVVGICLGVFVVSCTLVNITRIYKGISKSVTQTRGKTQLNNKLKHLITTIIKEVPIQLRSMKCKDETVLLSRIRSSWFTHMTIFWGFIGLAVATTLRFLSDQVPNWLQGQFSTIPEIVPITDPIRLLGTLSGLLLFYGVAITIWNRYKKVNKSTSYSTFTDWLFLFLIFLAGLTGYFVEIGIYSNLPLWSYVTLVAHIIVVFELILLAPLTKFAHAIYRTMAIWLTKV